jgi:hypothetical protein
MRVFVLTIFFLIAAEKFWPQDAESQSCPGMIMSPEWTECRRVVHSACAFVGASQSATCEAEALQRHLLAQQIAQQRNGVSPVSGWLCPSTHPIKGNFTTYNGERCIFDVPGGQFYDKTKPEMCYASPADAIADGCRASLR